MVSGVHNKKALVSNIYGNNISVTLKVVNDSDTFVTFKKGNSIGHAESADLVLLSNDHCSVAQASGQAHEGTEQENLRAQDMPEHLTKITFWTFRRMKRKNLSKYS